MDELNISDQSSREEKILGSMTGDYDGQLEPPMSRVEQLLLKLKDKISSIGKDIGSITEIDFKKVAKLPETGEKGIIYLVQDKHSEKDLYDEYMWLGDSWEKLGNTDIDLTQYATKDEIKDVLNRMTDLEEKVKDQKSSIDDNGIVTLGGATISQDGIITI